MNKEVKEIREYISCPQFGDDYYGEWGALTLKQRIKIKQLYDYITNLQQENERLKEWKEDLLKENIELENIRKEAIEYITSYESISTIQGLDKIEQNKQLDERTMNVMVERYLQVHHNLLKILQNGSDDNE